jgi:hypothetical protein
MNLNNNKTGNHVEIWTWKEEGCLGGNHRTGGMTLFSKLS